MAEEVLAGKLAEMTANEAFVAHVELFWEMVELRSHPNYDEAKDDDLADEMANLWYMLKPEHRKYLQDLAFEYNKTMNKNSRYYIPHVSTKSDF